MAGNTLSGPIRVEHRLSRCAVVPAVGRGHD